MNPYEQLDENSYWSPAVGQKNMLEISGLWKPGLQIDAKTPVVTFGSCFAQYIGRALVDRGFNWINREPAPTGLSEANIRRFNYNVFSARTANIYTTSLLDQWMSWALDKVQAPEEIWESGGRYFDPFRPTIEPDGFESVDELLRSRAATLEALARCVKESRVFVFTLGLTERWIHSDNGHEYPMCPGTAAGDFDEAVHEFENMHYPIVRKKLVDAMDRMRRANPKIKFLLTVSPVPLTATKSGKHVLVASSFSKSVLRAVAGDLADKLADVDYFPSYEIISAPPFRGTFFNPNQRTVTPRGVAFVMEHFFEGLGRLPGSSGAKGRAKGNTPKGRKSDQASQDVVCEEELLNAFSGNT